MHKFNSSNVKLSNSQFTKLKSGIKNILSNMAGGSNDENDFPHKLLLTDTKTLRFCIAFANDLSANIKF